MGYQTLRALTPIRHSGVLRIPGQTSGDNAQDFVAEDSQAARLVGMGYATSLGVAAAPVVPGATTGAGGPLTARRALARKVRTLSHRRFWNDQGGYEVMRLSPAYATGQMFQGEARLSSDGKTVWLVSRGGNSTAEPVRDANYPYKDILDAGGAVIWSPFDASAFPLTKRDTLRAAGGAIALPVVANVGAGQAAPQDANSNVLTERYNTRKALQSLSPSTWEAYQIANHPQIDSPAAWNATDPGDSGGCAQSVSVAGGVVTPIVSDTAPCFRFFTKAKAVSITIPGRSGATVGETSIANGNIIVEGVAIEPFTARGATVTVAPWQQQYTWTFADELEREFVVYGDGAWPQAIYTSANQGIYPQPQSVVRCVYASDSTGAGAAPGPHGFTGGQWGAVAMGYIGAMAGVTSIATGGIGYLSRPLSPDTVTASLKVLNVRDKLRFNQPYWDVRVNGGKKIDVWLLDQVGWDVDTSPQTYASESGSFVFANNGGAATWSIDSAQRKALFREILTTMLTWQPDSVFVAVAPRTPVVPGTPAVNARGYWNIDGFSSDEVNRLSFNQMADDWFDALVAVIPADQLCYISLTGFAENMSKHTVQWHSSTPQNDIVHPVTRYHHMEGVYIGQQILRWLSLS